MKLITQTMPINKKWKNDIKKRWWATDYKGNIDEILNDHDDVSKLLLLRRTLLDYGGEEVCLPLSDEDVDNISNLGMLFIPKPLTSRQKGYAISYSEMIGEPSQCHENSAELFWNNKDNEKIAYEVAITTGYALSEDGMWRQHSWVTLVQDDDPIEIIETTEERVAYYGFIMSKEECLEFCSHYYWL